MDVSGSPGDYRGQIHAGNDDARRLIEPDALFGQAHKAQDSRTECHQSKRPRGRPDAASSGYRQACHHADIPSALGGIAVR